MRGRAAVARRAHNPEVIGSNPIPATEYNRRPPGYLKKASPAVFGSWTWQKQEKIHEPQTAGLDHFQSRHWLPAVQSCGEGLSVRTTDSYQRILAQWLERQKDVEVSSYTSLQLRDYLNYMRTEYVPKRITGNNDQKLSSKSIRNIYVGLSAFFHWASEEFQIPNPSKNLPGAQIHQPEVEPFTKEEIEALLKACDFCDEAGTDRRKKFTMRRATARRDRAIILTLIDSGLRAS